MSMDKSKLEKIKDQLALTCCRFEAGTAVDEKVLEDPNLIPDFVDSGLVTIPDNALKIGQVLGGKLKVTVDALSILTPDNVEGYQAIENPQSTESEPNTQEKPETSLVTSQSVMNNGMVNISIAKGENIQISFPVNGNAQVIGANNQAILTPQRPESSEGVGTLPSKEKSGVLRTLRKEYVKVDEVRIGNETSFQNKILTVDQKLLEPALKKGGELVKKIDCEVITQDHYSQFSNTLMDIQPIATKIEGELGNGVTRILDKVVLVLSGIDETGKQIGEFGSSEGAMDRNIMWGRPGAPDFGDIFLKVNVVIKAHAGMERPGPLAAHLAADVITQAVRDVLKQATDVEITHVEEFAHTRRPGKPKVAVLKEIMGQGAMHDNLILPMEPVGTIGAVPNVDLGNLPIAMSPLELLDGGIHALTCIGPASKETSRHYFREPLIQRALLDEDIDFMGLVIVGSPQVNNEKFYVSKRVGQMFEYMNCDGAIITTEGFGNNHIDFAEHHRSIGKTGTKVVGMSYAAVQGAVVVGNEYMYAMVDLNKSMKGIENEILSNNTLCDEDAVRALVLLKAVMAGEEIEEAERRWNPNVKLANVALIEKELAIQIPLAANEQSLKLSKKRQEIYKDHA